MTIVAAVTFALLLLTTGCTTETDQLTSPQRPAKVGTIELVRAQDCTRLAEAVYERQAAIKRFEERMPVPSMSDEGMGVQSTVPSSAAAAAPADQSAGADRSSPVPPTSAGNVVAGTNIQEGGVDEGDMVKTDGAHMYVLSADGTFRVVELGDHPRVL
ncbi:MAG: beta-propeller domain-containing protein, partial [Actinobacteria bacterium]|nr:beta-propeller domain-containing protein [Actinomycetota bacterium]